MISVGIGLLLGTVGIEPIYSYSRFTFGSPYIVGGISFLPVMIGLYAIGEILSRVLDPSNYSAVADSSKSLISMPRISEFFSRRAPLLRGTVLGTVIGIITGAGANPEAFIPYTRQNS